MKAILIALLLSMTTMVASGNECSIKNTSDFLDDTFCRRVMMMTMVERYDKVSIKNGYRISTDKENNDMWQVIFKAGENCYQTCLLKNMD